jgi:hypothetical protein
MWMGQGRSARVCTGGEHLHIISTDAFGGPSFMLGVFVGLPRRGRDAGRVLTRPRANCARALIDALWAGPRARARGRGKRF